MGVVPDFLCATEGPLLFLPEIFALPVRADGPPASAVTDLHGVFKTLKFSCQALKWVFKETEIYLISKYLIL